MSPLIRALDNEEYFIVYTGQNYFRDNKKFFEELRLPNPKYHLSPRMPINYGSFCYRLKKLLDSERPDLALVHGDTNTTLFGSIVASECEIPIAHIEAGLRCYDSELPEEINRVATDHLAKFLFVPSEEERLNLSKEGLKQGVYIVGNTIVDAVRENIELAKSKKRRLPSKYFLLTLHRQENVNNPIQLKKILSALIRVYNKCRIPFIFPLHPRTQDKIEKFALRKIIENRAFIPVPPMGYLECLHYQLNALLILTDSGGIQEEACILKVPCITLRRSTERTATLKIGSNVLVNPDQYDTLETYVGDALVEKREWDNPFGNGRSAGMILQIIRENLK
jgi:UDP-N-acetylglucosamine 2-epimerase (non-hydrolysing)